MNTQLTPAQVSFYQDSGFLVIEDFLNASELAHWSKITNEAVEQRLAANAEVLKKQSKDVFTTSLNNQTDPEAYYAQVFTQCIKMADTHAGMHELMHDPRLGEMAATLAGVDGIRIWRDQALFKPPFGNPTGWHRDNPY